VESQFFISGHSNGPDLRGGYLVKNKISEYIVDRICRAFEEKKLFKVYILVPIHPEGDVKGSVVQSIMYWQFRTIGRSTNSMINTLNRLCPGINISDYITFNSLYKYGQAPSSGQFVSEQIYIHSKLLIVDDRHALIGSQNINDRSLVGDRDTEIGLVIHDGTETVEAEFGGEKAQVVDLVRQYRVGLMQEHLGIADLSSYDPSSDEFFKDIWCAGSRKNTEILDDVFPGKVKDSINLATELVQLRQQLPRNTERLVEVQGTLVDYPLNFYSQENLLSKLLAGVLGKNMFQ